MALLDIRHELNPVDFARISTYIQWAKSHPRSELSPFPWWRSWFRQDRTRERTSLKFPNVSNLPGNHGAPPVLVRTVRMIRARYRSRAHIGKLDETIIC